MGRIIVRFAALATIGFVLAGCSSSDGAQPAVPTATAASSGIEAPATPTAPPTPTAPVVEAQELETSAPSVVYGGVTFSLIGAELSNEDPASRENNLGLPSTSAYLYLDIAVNNPAQRSALTVNDREFIFLQVNEASPLLPAELQSADIVPRSVIGPQTVGAYQVRFEVEESFDFSAAALVVGSPRSEQVLMRFGDSSWRKTEFVAGLDPALMGQVDGGVGCGPALLRASVDSVQVDLDLPADISSSGNLPRRAARGQVFVEIAASFEVLDAGGTGCGATTVPDELVNVTVAGAAESERYIDGDESFDAAVGETVTLVVGFMVPAEGEAVAVELGRTNGRTLTSSVSWASLE